MTKARDIDIARALVCMCEGFAILTSDQDPLIRTAKAGEPYSYNDAAKQLKQAILDMKAQLCSLQVDDVPLTRALALTCDEDICADLPTDAQAQNLDLSAEEQMHLVQSRHFDFIHLCQHGLCPPNFQRSTTQAEDLLTEIIWMYHRAPSEAHAQALRLWASRGLSVAKLLLALQKTYVIRDAGTASLISEIIKERVSADPINAEQALRLMAAVRSETFSVMALMLAGAEPDEDINARGDAALILKSFASNHGRMAMERKYGPLDRHLLKQNYNNFALTDEHASLP